MNKTNMDKPNKMNMDKPYKIACFDKTKYKRLREPIGHTIRIGFREQWGRPGKNVEAVGLGEGGGIHPGLLFDCGGREFITGQHSC